MITKSVPRSTNLLKRSFLSFYLGRTIDLAGGSMTPVVLTLGILTASGSITDAGVVAAATMFPMLVLLVLGGVVADRGNRRTVLVVTNILSAAVRAGMGVMLLTGHYTLVAAIVLGVCSGFISAFSGPAMRGIVPELVASDQLQRANALLAATSSVVRVGGPLLAGILVATLGGGPALVVDAVCAVAAALFYLRITSSTGEVKHQESIIQGLKTGWRTFSSIRWIWISSISFAVINALNVAPLQILGSAIVLPVLGAAGWGAILSGRTVGMMLAGVLLVRRPLGSPLIYGRLIGTLSALPLIGFGATDNFWLLLIASFIGGAGFSVLGISYDSTLHTKVSTTVLSRVSSYDDLIAYGSIPIAQILVGPAAEAFGNHQLAIWCGIGLILATLIPLIFPSIRAVDELPDASNHRMPSK